MIKSFKDFDDDFKGQKIYEAEVIENESDKNVDIPNEEEDITIPEMLSDNKFLLKISKIVLKRLEASGIGEFGVYPTVITIEDVPGVYFYCYENPSINIVICRNTYGKHVYLFKEFIMGEKNVADLVLSTTKLGFSDMIDQLISNLTPDAIEEGLICEWSEGSFNYSEKDVEKVALMDISIRQAIINLLKDNTANKVAISIFNKNTVKPFDVIYEAIASLYGKINQSNVKKVVDIFDRALNNKTDHDEVYSVLADCKTSGTAVSSSSGVSAMVDDGLVDELTKARELEIEEDTKEYAKSMDDIYKVATTMCKYVKNNCELSKDDWGVMRSRGMLITGKAGVGKTESITRALNDMDMKPNKDYFEISSGSTSVSSLYKKFYDYNGKLLIFDDSADLFDTKYKLSFWKLGLNDKVDKAIIELSHVVSDDEKSETGIYVPGKLTRQQRYFTEIGKSSRKEKLAFIKEHEEEEKRKLIKKKTEIDPYDTLLSPTDKAHIDATIEKLWKEHEETKKPKMPNRFKFKGVVIVISNETQDAFIKSVKGYDNWDAIVTRMRNFDLHPMSESMWRYIKNIILTQKDRTDIDDDYRLVPKDLSDEFIEEVENLMKGDRYRKMNFRMIANDMHKVLNSALTLPEWKDTLKELMSIKTKR